MADFMEVHPVRGKYTRRSAEFPAHSRTSIMDILPLSAPIQYPAQSGPSISRNTNDPAEQDGASNGRLSPFVLLIVSFPAIAGLCVRRTDKNRPPLKKPKRQAPRERDFSRPFFDVGSRWKPLPKEWIPSLAVSPAPLRPIWVEPSYSDSWQPPNNASQQTRGDYLS